MAKKAKKTLGTYTVICGCDTADGKRYEVGDPYDASDHDESITSALLEMNCLEEANGDS